MKLLKTTIKAVLVLVAAAGLFWLILGFFPDPLAEKTVWDWSVRISDRYGRPLKDFLPPVAARREARPLADFSPNLLTAVLTTEDKRFYRHPGVDPLAMLRALWLNLSRGRIVSGASTITMQLARLNRGLTPGPRTMGRKLREIWWALLIERHHSKDEILGEYLNRAPCGNLTEGFPAAARLYLNKSVSDLSAAEAAFLAGLPASPGALNPYKDPRPALARRSRILSKMAGRGFLSPEALRRAQEEPLGLEQARSPFKAPHFVSYLRRQFGPEPPPLIVSTLDLSLQEQVEELVRKTAAAWREQGLSQAAVLVMSLPERQVLAWVGSADFFDALEGQNDGVLALRQPGSALKPFLYATAFDDGLISPASLMDDRAVDYLAPQGSFSPANYSGTFHGLVSARLALASSLNLPAVKLVQRVGVERLLARFRELGLDSLSREAEYYGLGLALGGGEVSLLNLSTAYAALADQGRLRPPLMIRPQAGEAVLASRSVFSPGAAFLVSDILSDPLARATGFGAHSVLDTPYPAAVKTGTSKSFRDNWCLGFTSSFVVGVWAGNFEASPMDKVSGVTGAGAIWREVADLLAKRYPTDDFRPPRGVISALICPVSGLLAGPACPNRQREFFLESQRPGDFCRHAELSPETLGAEVPVLGLSRGFALMRPLSGELYAYDPSLSPQVQRIMAQAQSVPGVDELVWRLNGREIKRQAVSGYARAGCLLPLARGAAHLEVLGLKEGRPVHKAQARFQVR
ncbi:MAG: penicillin-binding protein 1C [Candidatus Adiutrix sp.]|jgi:penicillin-binding protein 1C|nr:penicillin-binding protein 1C [Candidatus Adiutrix sp.]